jgi:hypothetical protein
VGILLGVLCSGEKLESHSFEPPFTETDPSGQRYATWPCATPGQILVLLLMSDVAMGACWHVLLIASARKDRGSQLENGRSCHCESELCAFDPRSPSKLHHILHAFMDS